MLPFSHRSISFGSIHNTLLSPNLNLAMCTVFVWFGLTICHAKCQIASHFRCPCSHCSIYEHRQTHDWSQHAQMSFPDLISKLRAQSITQINSRWIICVLDRVGLGGAAKFHVGPPHYRITLTTCYIFFRGFICEIFLGNQARTYQIRRAHFNQICKALWKQVVVDSGFTNSIFARTVLQSSSDSTWVLLLSTAHKGNRGGERPNVWENVASKRSQVGRPTSPHPALFLHGSLWQMERTEVLPKCPDAPLDSQWVSYLSRCWGNFVHECSRTPEARLALAFQKGKSRERSDFSKPGFREPKLCTPLPPVGFALQQFPGFLCIQHPTPLFGAVNCSYGMRDSHRFRESHRVANIGLANRRGPEFHRLQSSIEDWDATLSPCNY